MKVSSHQPNFIPWLGYFYKVHISDAFVIADDVDFSRKSYINRNRIKNAEVTIWLTIPVKKAPIGTAINKMEISSMQDIEKLLRIIKSSYSKATFFNPFYTKFAETILSKGKNLADINIALLNVVLEELNIKTRILYTSSLPMIESGSTERIISICKALEADTYISGFGGQNYQSVEEMNIHGINCQIYKFTHPEYIQLWGKFAPNMSIIDLIFNCGPQAEIILKSI